MKTNKSHFSIKAVVK